MILVIGPNHEAYIKWREEQGKTRFPNGCREVTRTSDLLDYPNGTKIVLLPYWEQHKAYVSINQYLRDVQHNYNLEYRNYRTKRVK